MAVFNNYPSAYPQYYPPIQQSVAPQPQQPVNNGIIWVQGEAGAKSYLVAPNSTVQLWDSENQVIYLKSADSSGMPSMKIIDYTIRGSESAVPINSVSGYVSREELTGVMSQIDELRSEIQKLKPKKKSEEA